MELTNTELAEALVVAGGDVTGSVTAGKVTVAVSSAVVVDRSWNTPTVGAEVGVESGFLKLLIVIETCDPLTKVPEVSLTVITPEA